MEKAMRDSEISLIHKSRNRFFACFAFLCVTSSFSRQCARGRPYFEHPFPVFCKVFPGSVLSFSIPVWQQSSLNDGQNTSTQFLEFYPSFLWSAVLLTSLGALMRKIACDHKNSKNTLRQAQFLGLSEFTTYSISSRCFAEKSIRVLRCKIWAWKHPPRGQNPWNEVFDILVRIDHLYTCVLCPDSLVVITFAQNAGFRGFELLTGTQFFCLATAPENRAVALRERMKKKIDGTANLKVHSCFGAWISCCPSLTELCTNAPEL